MQSVLFVFLYFVCSPVFPPRFPHTFLTPLYSLAHELFNQHITPLSFGEGLWGGGLERLL